MSEDQPVQSKQLQPTDLDIFVKVFITSLLSPASHLGIGTGGPTLLPLESFVNLATRKKMQSSSSKQNNTDEIMPQAAPLKSVLDQNLPVLSQILVVGVVNGIYTLSEVDQYLSSLTFRLFTLFLQRSQSNTNGNSNEYLNLNATLSPTSNCESFNTHWIASQLEIMKMIRLLIETRPISLSKSFIKHMYPYLNQIPKTAAAAHLLTEVSYQIITNLFPQRT